MNNINLDTIRTYVKQLEQKGYSNDVVARKLESTLQFLRWAYHKDFIKYSLFQQLKDEVANFKVRFEVPNFHKAQNLEHHQKVNTPTLQDFSHAHYSGEKSTKGLGGEFYFKFRIETYKLKSFLQGILHRVPLLGQSNNTHENSKDNQPSHSSLNPQYYVGMAFVLVIMAILGAGIYTQFFASSNKIFAYPSAPSAASRILSFQGRLTDSLGNPITAATNMRFRLYTASSGGTTLYDSGTCSISPDQDGVHNVLIGSDCGSEVASSVFTENTQVWLGVLVGSDPEMTPRQRIANVPYAINAETLQGLPVGTEVSNIPYINAGGDLLMAAASPQIGSTYVSQDFLVSSAKAITLQAAGTGDVTLTATESGTIKFATGGSQHGVITNTGLFGFGTTGPDAKLDVLYTGGEQLRLTYTDGSNYTGFTTNSSGDLTIDPSGGDVFLANNDVLNIGGSGSDTAYNTIADSTAGASANVNSDNDLYIEGNLEVDGTIYGNVSGTISTGFTQGSVIFADGSGNLAQDNASLYFDDTNNKVGIGTTAPSGKLHVSGAAVGKALSIFNETGDQNIITASASGTTVANLDRSGNLAIEGAISDLGGTTLAVNDNLDVSGTLFSGTADAFQVDATGNITAVGGTLSGDLAINGGDLTSTSTAFKFDIGNTGTLQFRDGTNALVSIKDQGVYAFLNLAAKTDTGDPGTCAEGDIYYNDTDDTIKICHESNTWEALDGGAVATSWTDSGTTVYLTDTTDEVVIGGSTPLSSAKVSIDGDADQIQLIVQGNATQTTGLAVFENSAGTDQFTISNTGDTVNAGNTTLGDAGADTVTSNAAAWTFASDTTVALTGGVNGINFDSNTLSIDATNDRIGIGTAAPDGKLQVTGASIGKALTILNETGDQDIIAASASGTTRFRVGNDGTVYGGYFADMSNTAYGIDPAGTSNFGGYSLKVTGGALLAADSGNVGIGDQTPDAKLNILATTEQLRLDYDDSNYTSFTVSSGGDLTLAPTGSDTNITGNLAISGGTTLGDASGDTVTANAAAWTFANDTTVALTGGVNGINFDSDTLSIDATNNRVGIGTAAPAAPLEVVGNTRVNTGVLQLYHAGTNPSIAFGNGGGASLANIEWNAASSEFRIGNTWAGGASSVDAFYADGSEKMRLTGTGLLGIGDTTPDAFLDITGTTAQLRLSYETGDTNYASFTLGSGGDLTIAPSGGDVGVTGNLDVSGGLNVATADHFNIDSSGNIGVGTTASGTYGLRMVKSVNPGTTPSYYTDHKAISYSGTAGSFQNEYGSLISVTEGTTYTGGNGSNHYLNQQSFTNNSTTWAGYSAYGNWTSMSNNAAANSAYLRGMRSDVTNGSTGTAQDYYAYWAIASNSSTGTITNTRGYVSDITNSSSGTISNAYGFQAGSPTNASGTITTAYGFYVGDQSVGTNTTAYGLYIANQSGSSGNAIGLYIADADDYSIQLASTDGDAASGITFGTDTNLYRNSANSLYTDDAFTAVGNITTSGDLAVNGDDITSDGNLTLNAAGYTRVGDTASPASANGDDDLFVEGDLEVDGVLYADGGIDTALTAGSVVFAGTSGVLAQDNSSFFFDDTNNRLGIGDTSPDAFVDITGTTEQLRLSYETGDTNYASFTLGSGGDLTIAPTGSDTNITGNLAVSGNTGLGDGATDVVTVTGKEIINFDTSATDQNGLYINSSQNTSTAGTLRGLNLLANYWATSGTQTGVNGLDFTVQATGNGGTVTTMKGISAWGVVGTGATVGTFKLADVANPSNSGTITSLSGFSVDNLTSGSNNTLILAGTTSIPTGNWGIYNSSAYTNYLSGTTGIGTTGPDAKLDVLATTEQLRLTYSDGSAYTSFTTNSSGDLTIAPSGGDMNITGTLAATSTITGSDFICTDCLDFAEFEDTLDLDTSLTLNQGTSTWTQNFTGTTTTGLTYNANSLTTGTAVAINSTSVDNTAATLLSLDWSPGSLVTSTDDLFKISTTNNGNLSSAYYINLIKEGSSIFNIAQSGNVTTTGDVAVNGDDITSDGTLTIDAATDINLDADGADIVFKDAGTTIATFTNTSTDLTILPAGGDVFITGNLSPTTDDTYDLGSNTARWKDLYIGPDTLHIGTSTSDEGTMSYTTSTNVLNIGGTGDLSIDMTGDDVATPDRLTVGSTTAGVGKLNVTGAEVGKALAIFNETGNQNIITASASGSTVYALTRDGDVTQVNDAGALDVHGDNYSLAPNASFEVNSDGENAMPDAWYAKAGTPAWTSTGGVHGDSYMELTNYLDNAMSACFPVGQETFGGTNKTYTLSLLYGSSYAGITAVLRWGLYTYTSRSDCQTDTSPATPGFLSVNPGNGNTWSYTSGTNTPADGEKWARVWLLNNDNGDTAAHKVDGVLVLPTNITSGLDLAETYPSNPADNLVAGEIVAFGTGEKQDHADVSNISRSTTEYDSKAFGVVATQPGLVLDDEHGYDKVKVALKGRVPVLVTTENGPIKVGDPITASSKPGIGMKATRSGRIVGYAMTEWTSTDPNEIDQVTVFVNPETYVDLSILTHLQESVAKFPSMTASVLTQADSILINTAEAMLIKTETLIASTIKATNATIDNLIVDRIISKEINSVTVKTETLQAQNIEAKDATFSGKLVAQEIDADNIRELRDRLERLSVEQNSEPAFDSAGLQEEVENIQNYLENLSEQEDSPSLPINEIVTNTPIDPGTTTSITGEQISMMNLENLTVTGTAAMASLAIADSFTAGNIFIKDNSVLSLNNELKLSALEQVNIMDGAVIIAKNGTITAKGEVIAEKGVRTNTIKPLDTESTVGLQLSQNKVEVLNNNSVVAAIDNDGSAKFKDVSVDTYTEATGSAAIIAAEDNYDENGILSPGIQTNAAAAGNGIIPAKNDTIVIFNDTISAKSLVYVTATSKTYNQNLYVAEKKSCTPEEKLEDNCKPYFTVHIDGTVKDAITFNWWIVN